MWCIFIKIWSSFLNLHLHMWKIFVLLLVKWQILANQICWGNIFYKDFFKRKYSSDIICYSFFNLFFILIYENSKKKVLLAYTSVQAIIIYCKPFLEEESRRDESRALPHYYNELIPLINLAPLIPALGGPAYLYELPAELQLDAWLKCLPIWTNKTTLVFWWAD